MHSPVCMMGPQRVLTAAVIVTCLLGLVSAGAKYEVVENTYFGMGIQTVGYRVANIETPVKNIFVQGWLMGEKVECRDMILDKVDQTTQHHVRAEAKKWKRFTHVEAGASGRMALFPSEAPEGPLELRGVVGGRPAILTARISAVTRQDARHLVKDRPPVDDGSDGEDSASSGDDSESGGSDSYSRGSDSGGSSKSASDSDAGSGSNSGGSDTGLMELTAGAGSVSVPFDLVSVGKIPGLLDKLELVRFSGTLVVLDGKGGRVAKALREGGPATLPVHMVVRFSESFEKAARGLPGILMGTIELQ